MTFRKKLMEKSRRWRRDHKIFLKLNICRWGMGKRLELLIPIFGSQLTAKSYNLAIAISACLRGDGAWKAPFVRSRDVLKKLLAQAEKPSERISGCENNLL
jgi:hypothetical protein